MRRILRAITGAALGFALAITPLRAQPGQIVIDDDPGGLVYQALMFYQRIKDSGVPVRLRGICDSACTYILTLPKSQVCVEPTASLGFHLATDDDNDTKGDIPETMALIRRYYPPAVVEWIMSGPPLTLKIRYMDAATIVKLGIFDACPQ